MVTPKKIMIQDLELADKEIKRLREENRILKERVKELEKEKRRDGLLGQATMDEAYNRIKGLEEENEKLKLHIEAKDKAYTALLKDYEELKEDNKRLRAEIEEWLNAVRKTLEK